jgi:multiple sugar transport system permease protein/putative aldouronate transport system permease protein
VVLGTICELSATLLMAYPLSKSVKQFPARNIIMWFLIFAMLFSGGLIPWYQTMKSLKLLNNIWGLVLGNSLPIFNVILVMNFFRNLPKEIEDAALLDGAGPWEMFLLIYLPLSKPVIATVTLFSMVYHWNEFFNGLVLTTRQVNYPLQTYIQQMLVVINTGVMTPEQLQMLNELSNQTLNAAKIFIAMIPILLIYPFLQKYFITGITLGSVKE